MNSSASSPVTKREGNDEYFAVYRSVDRPTRADIAKLEAIVEERPDAVEPRENLLEAYCIVEGGFSDPRRVELIEWFLQHHPRHMICSTPFMQVDPATAPDAYARLKARWLAHVKDTPSDAQLVRGAAAFISAESLDAARRLLRAGVTATPTDARLWLDLGRASTDPVERLAAFERARELDKTLPNLLAWIAQTAVEAGDALKAENAARELLQFVDDARIRFGDKLDWTERGGDLWRRARASCSNDDAAQELTNAISEHAYRKHWAHTVLGMLACRRGDLDAAVAHLRASADIRPDHRLAAYGPSLDLVRELCATDGVMGSTTSARGSACGLIVASNAG